MDENKELLNEDTKEEAAFADTENTEEAANSAENTERDYGSFLEEAEHQADGNSAYEAAEPAITDETQEAEQPQKKKPFVQKTILISAAIVICAFLAALVFMLFFNNGIAGTWHYVRTVQFMAEATADEPASQDIDYYFDFKKDGTVVSTIGTVSSKGTYEIVKDDNGQQVIAMDLTDLLTSSSFLSSGYNISFSGNAFTGRRFTLANPQSEEDVLEFESAKYTAPELQHESEFEAVEGLTGTWIYNQDGYNLSYTFNADGTAKYTEAATSYNPYTYQPVNVNIEIDGIYDVTSQEITNTDEAAADNAQSDTLDVIAMKYVYTEETSMSIVYQLDGDTLYVNGYAFTREGAATKD